MPSVSSQLQEVKDETRVEKFEAAVDENDGIVDVAVGRLTYGGAPHFPPVAWLSCQHRTCQLAPLNCTDRET